MYTGNPKQLAEDLEAMIDKFGVKTLLDTLTTICDEKADHVSTNWQDRKTAKAWEKTGSKLQRLISKIEVR